MFRPTYFNQYLVYLIHLDGSLYSVVLLIRKGNSQVISGTLGVTQLLSRWTIYLSPFPYHLGLINTLSGKAKHTCMETNQENIWGLSGQRNLHALEARTIDSVWFWLPGELFPHYPCCLPFPCVFPSLPHFSSESPKFAWLSHTCKAKRIVFLKFLRRDFKYLVDTLPSLAEFLQTPFF